MEEITVSPAPWGSLPLPVQRSWCEGHAQARQAGRGYPAANPPLRAAAHAPAPVSRASRPQSCPHCPSLIPFSHSDPGGLRSVLPLPGHEFRHETHLEHPRDDLRSGRSFPLPDVCVAALLKRRTGHLPRSPRGSEAEAPIIKGLRKRHIVPGDRQPLRN